MYVWKSELWERKYIFLFLSGSNKGSFEIYFLSSTDELHHFTFEYIPCNRTDNAVRQILYRYIKPYENASPTLIMYYKHINYFLVEMNALSIIIEPLIQFASITCIEPKKTHTHQTPSNTHRSNESVVAVIFIPCILCTFRFDRSFAPSSYWCSVCFITMRSNSIFLYCWY